MTQELCFFCDKNKLEHTYQCCQKQCCNECYASWYAKNKLCPWCRQDPSIFNFKTDVNNKYKNIFLHFENWLKENNIKNSYNTKRCIKHIKIMDECFQNKQSPTIKFQVANLNKIHVFKYSNYTQISFKYHERWDLIEVKGGQYLFYDKLHNSDNFGWWLHGFVKQI